MAGGQRWTGQLFPVGLQGTLQVCAVLSTLESPWKGASQRGPIMACGGLARPYLWDPQCKAKTISLVLLISLHPYPLGRTLSEI